MVKADTGFMLMFLLFWGYILYKLAIPSVKKTPPVPYTYEPRRDLLSMRPVEFERHCAAWLTQQGFETELTPGSGDGNVDILIRNRPAGILLGIAECKRWQSPVGAKELKVLYASMLQRNVRQAWFFSTGGFSPRAESYVRQISVDSGCSINLIGGNEL